MPDRRVVFAGGSPGPPLLRRSLRASQLQIRRTGDVKREGRGYRSYDPATVEFVKRENQNYTFRAAQS
jgi:hypothetical protein